mmetsp:Transcript_3584/g.11295  ORF Transcript_3584/g.11295 Transcript_3584/m.11295 type:complete len:211 (+) Transcript_3584:459-1091(+)
MRPCSSSSRPPRTAAPHDPASPAAHPQLRGCQAAARRPLRQRSGGACRSPGPEAHRLPPQSWTPLRRAARASRWRRRRCHVGAADRRLLQRLQRRRRGSGRQRGSWRRAPSVKPPAVASGSTTGCVVRRPLRRGRPRTWLSADAAPGTHRRDGSAAAVKTRRTINRAVLGSRSPAWAEGSGGRPAALSGRCSARSRRQRGSPGAGGGPRR